MCNFLSFVSPQQKFELVDQCYSSVTAQVYLASKGKYILKTWGWTDPKEAQRWLLFYTLFLLPLSRLYVNWAGRESCLFHLRFSLRVGGYSFVPFSAGCSFLCLLATDILDSFYPILTNKVIGWHHQVSGHEFEETPGEDWSATVHGVAESWLWCFCWLNNNNKRSVTLVAGV